MENRSFREYLYLGLTALAVVAASLVLWVCFQHWSGFARLVGSFFGILAPFIDGAVLAYLLSPIYNAVRRFIIDFLHNSSRAKRIAPAVGFIAKAVATLISVFLVIFTVVGVISLILPQLISSIIGIWESLPGYWDTFNTWVSRLLSSNPEMKATVSNLLQSAYDTVISWGSGADAVSPETAAGHVNIVQAFSGLINQLSDDGIAGIVAQLGNSVLGILTQIKNWILGLIVMMYFLNIKEVLLAQIKKMIYSIFPVGLANEIVYEARYVNRVFGGFIVGKIIDSIIIGFLCFFCISLMKMPYPMLISTIIGVTNVIPFFGPFFGAIPSAILVLLVSPLKCLYFLVFILILQQFDGNILGPRILGGSTGLPSFWVMFAILFFGSLFGFVGMIIGVPLLAVILNLVSRAVNHSLKKRNLPLATADYMDFAGMDEASGKVIPKDKAGK
jgi:predicted PurR-regulated permease PerM